MVALEAQLNAQVVGQKRIAHALVVALLADGHVLLEGPPGVAKTRVATALAGAIEGAFRRAVLSPDMRVVDLFGAAVDGASEGDACGRAGPIFANILLAEGVGHASPEVRLALLDAMAERYVAVDGTTVDLPDVFFVCATHSPTPRRRNDSALGPAERDRFLVHLRVGYPDEVAERHILGMAWAEGATPDAIRSAPGVRMPLAVVLVARETVRAVKLGATLQRRIISLVSATRGGALQRNDPGCWIGLGSARARARASPSSAARAHAWLAGRRRVTECDIAAVAHDVLRHRLEPSNAAEEAGVTADAVIDQLLAHPSAK